MTNVYFITHAESDFNIRDDLRKPLTTKGTEDAKLVTAFLEDKDIHAVLSSPCLRAYDTIKNFAGEKRLSVKTIHDFRERKVDNEWIDDYSSFMKKQWDDFDYKLSSGESLREVQNRNINALNNALSSYEGKNIVIGTHGTALSTMINYYQNSYGYDDFVSMRKLIPRVVKIEFDKNECVSMSHIDIFNNVCSC